MARSKKLSTEELKARKRARERARYAKIKADQVLNELQKEKERKKYENKKIKKQVKLVADMTPRERRVHRKLWREKFKKHYQRKCTNTSYIQLTPPSSPENNADQRPQSVQVNSGKKRIHRDRSKIIKRNKKLQEENEKLRRQRDMYRKRHERSKLQKAPRHDKTDDTPKTKIRKLMKKKNHKQLIQRQLIFGEAMKQQLKLNFKQMRKEKKFFCEIVVQGLRRSNAAATEFIVKDNDVFTIPYESIKQILPEPTPIWKKRIITYKFSNTVGVYEK
uniref:Uncharacterized protein n=1 Tax=Cacopsylla melanoneura TaxID=428564 RepID=A0A8D8QR80_9HEMI